MLDCYSLGAQMASKHGSVVTLSKKTHPKFLSVYLQYPQVLRVLENIQAGRVLSYGLELSMQSKDVLLITIEHLYLPVLESSGLIAKDSSIASGWKALATEVRFEPGSFTAKDKAKVVAAVANEIATTIQPIEGRETVFSVNVSGSHSKESIQKFFESVRQVALEILNTPSETEKNCVEFRLVMLGHSGGDKV
jgi:hypothetical protein